MLTTERIKGYIASPDECPHCGSEALSAGNFDAAGNVAWRIVTCSACKKEWRENFTLTSIEEEP